MRVARDLGHVVLSGTESSELSLLVGEEGGPHVEQGVHGGDLQHALVLAAEQGRHDLVQLLPSMAGFEV